ncbi:MAG: hypothetical protein F6J89_30300, partial [Symploca sp. SIO1C4]|nr:hypothetical protein [Symploca sp. SIO1C4]
MSTISAKNAEVEYFPPSYDADAEVQTVTYTWDNIAIGGMGFVTGIGIHPTEPGIVYVRTDVGGIYRWDSVANRWIPLMDEFGESEEHHYGIESIALDPNNPDILYAATGYYTRETTSDILKSTDRGQNWVPTELKTPAGTNVRMGGNEDWRWTGERLAVDPSNSNIIYFGSRLDGLYKSENSANTWNKVTSFSATDLSEGGITFVLFDPQSGHLS